MAGEDTPETISFIDEALITNLATSNADLPIKLLAHCRSLNNSYRAGDYTTMVMVIRGILDYVPTIFGFASTSQTYS